MAPQLSAGGAKTQALAPGAALACTLIAATQSKSARSTPFHVSVFAGFHRLFQGLADRARALPLKPLPLKQTADAALASTRLAASSVRSACESGCATIKGAGTAAALAAGETAREASSLASQTLTDTTAAARAACLTASTSASALIESASSGLAATVASAEEATKPYAAAVRATMGGAAVAAASAAKASYTTVHATALSCAQTLGKLPIGPSEVAATALLCVTTVTLKRARELRQSRASLLAELNDAEQALNASRAAQEREVSLLRTKFDYASTRASKARTDAELAELRGRELEQRLRAAVAEAQAKEAAWGAQRNATAVLLRNAREAYARRSRQRDASHAEELERELKRLATVEAAHKAKRQVAARLLGMRKRQLLEAVQKAESLRAAASQSEREAAHEGLSLIEARDLAAAAAAAAQRGLAEAEEKAEKMAKEVVLFQSMASAEKKRADGALERLRTLETEISAREGRLAESSPSIAAKASLESLRLQLHAAREQLASARTAQRKQAMDAARAASEAANQLGDMQQRLAQLEAAHASETARSEALWAQREAEFRADLQAAHTRRTQERAVLELTHAELQATNAELEARLRSAQDSERTVEDSLKLARADAKAARVAAEQQAAKAASLEEALGEARVDVQRYKHDASALHGEHDEQLARSEVALRRAQEALERERSLRQRLQAEKAGDEQALRASLRSANAALQRATREGEVERRRAADEAVQLEKQAAVANRKAEALEAELKGSRAAAQRAEALAVASKAEADAMRSAAARESMAAARRARSAAAAGVAAPTVKKATPAVKEAASPSAAHPPSSGLTVDASALRPVREPARPTAPRALTASTALPRVPSPLAQRPAAARAAAPPSRAGNGAPAEPARQQAEPARQQAEPARRQRQAPPLRAARASYHVPSWGLDSVPGVSAVAAAASAPTAAPRHVAAASTSHLNTPKATAKPQAENPKPTPSSKPPPAAQTRPTRRLLSMLVSQLPQHVAPSRLLSEFPTAISAEATYDTKTGTRTAVVLAFERDTPPSTRTSKTLGCVLQPIVTAPIGTETSRTLKWHRKDGAVHQQPVDTKGHVASSSRAEELHP